MPRSALPRAQETTKDKVEKKKGGFSIFGGGKKKGGAAATADAEPAPQTSSTTPSADPVASPRLPGSGVAHPARAAVQGRRADRGEARPPAAQGQAGGQELRRPAGLAARESRTHTAGLWPGSSVPS